MLEEWPYFNGKGKVKEGVRETGFPGGSDGKGSACNAGDLGLIPRLGRSPGGGHGNPLQHSCLENPHGQRSPAGYSPQGHKESDTTEQLAQHSKKDRRRKKKTSMPNEEFQKGNTGGQQECDNMGKNKNWIKKNTGSHTLPKSIRFYIKKNENEIKLDFTLQGNTQKTDQAEKGLSSEQVDRKWRRV